MSTAALETLKAVNYEVTQEALVKNVNEDLQKVALEESHKQLAEWEASQKKALLEASDDEFDEMDDDPVLKQLQQKRLEELKSRYRALNLALLASLLNDLLMDTGNSSRSSSLRRGTANTGRSSRRSS